MIKRLFKVNRLPFGVSAARAIFQRMTEVTLAGIPGMSVYLDDIIINGKGACEHEDHLEQVSTRLSEMGLRLRKDNCHLGITSVDFLGHPIDANGVHATKSKIKAILQAPKPTDKTSLRAFLGLILFYDRFLRNKAHVAVKLYRLPEKNEH